MILHAQHAQTLLFPYLADILNFGGVAGLVAVCLELFHDSLERYLCITDAAGCVQLFCMELGGVDGEHLNIRIAEQHPLGTGNEVIETGADTNNEVAVLAECVRRQTSGYADAADCQLKRIRQAGMAGLGLRNRNVERLAEVHCGLTGLGVTNAAACDEHRLLGA